MGVYVDKSDKLEKKITGAGVIIVEDYRTMNNTDENTIPTILIGRNKASQTSSDFGGGFSKKHKKISKTASDELLEESRNLIHVSEDILEDSVFFDISGTRDTYYRVYVIKGQNVSTKFFLHNRRIIDSHPQSKRQWRETDFIYHIPIDNIEFDKLLERKKVKVLDVHDHEVTLHMRLRKALFYGKEQILETVKSGEEIFTRSDLITVEDNTWLDGTSQFKA
jgi:hypothetical protein